MGFQNGDLVGDFQVLARIGAGGMGEVYKVRNTISDRIEALKILLPDLRAEPELAERFLREIKLHATLQHPNIAALHSAQRIDNQLFMLLEYVEGHTLREYADQARIPLNITVNYMCQVLDALVYAHEHGIIHRDIKPSNIMVTPTGIVKLMDFGIASSAAVTRLTRTGAAVGSLFYMSPEQISSQPIDGRTDIYAVGATLYELACGRVPFEADNEYALMSAHLRQRPTPPSQHNSAVSAELSSAILRALEKDPASRFPNAREFRAALLGLDSVRAKTPVPAAAVVEIARKQLAVYIGPIAGVLVSRASRKAATVEELYDLLSREIENPADRAKFLKSAPGR